MLTKTQRIFDLDRESDGSDPVIFNHDRDEDDATIDSVLLVSVADWCDLGQPTRLTVSIEPGDHLNG